MLGEDVALLDMSIFPFTLPSFVLIASDPVSNKHYALRTTQIQGWARKVFSESMTSISCRVS